jgi:hypothetical protein
LSFIDPPKKIPFFLKIGIWIARRKTKKEMLPARILSWYPKAAISSGIMESFAAHDDKTPGKRLLKLIRMQTSFIVSCPGISLEDLSLKKGDGKNKQ